MNFCKFFLAIILGFFPVTNAISSSRAPAKQAPSDSVAKRAFFVAAQTGQIDKIKRLISSGTIDCPNQNGITALMFGAYFGHLSIVQFLLSKKADITVSSNSNQDFNFGKLLSNRNSKTTALMLAAFAGKLEIVLALLKAGAQTNAQDSDGQTALMYAILADQNWPNQPLSENCKKIITALLEFGADPTIPDNNGLDARYYYSQVAGLIPSFGDRYEKDPELVEQDELLKRMKLVI